MAEERLDTLQTEEMGSRAMIRYGIKAAIARMIVHRGYRDQTDPDRNRDNRQLAVARVLWAAGKLYKWGQLPYETGSDFTVEGWLDYAMNVVGDASNREWPNYGPIKPYVEAMIETIRKDVLRD